MEISNQVLQRTGAGRSNYGGDLDPDPGSSGLMSV